MIISKIFKKYYKGTKAKKIFSLIYNFATTIREFFTGYVIFDIITGTFYEVAVSKALEKRESLTAIISLFTSYLIIILYTMEVLLMCLEASRHKIIKLELAPIVNYFFIIGK